MNDEEMKRLEGIAKEAERRNLLTGETFPEWSEFLALIERVRTAERKGAEEMRKAVTDAAFRLREQGGVTLPEWTGMKDLLAEVVGLPLPGDAP